MKTAFLFEYKDYAVVYGVALRTIQKWASDPYGAYPLDDPVQTHLRVIFQKFQPAGFPELPDILVRRYRALVRRNSKQK